MGPPGGPIKAGLLFSPTAHSGRRRQIEVPITAPGTPQGAPGHRKDSALQGSGSLPFFAVGSNDRLREFMDFLTSPEFWVALGQIIIIDILLGGDNAVVVLEDRGVRD